jgi:hypothetical protein
MERLMVKHLVKGSVAILAAITIVLSACTYDTSYGDCAVHCTADSGCPDELTCGPEGLCRAAEAEACVVPNDGTGGTITHVDGRTIHTFAASQSGSTFTPPIDMSSIELLVVSGGGGGGITRGGGGGGGGGLVYEASYALDQSLYAVTVGYGGASSTSGGDSAFGTITAKGGGAGRSCFVTPNGGSGGGASHDTNDGPAGSGTSGQGNRGGSVGFNSGSMTFTGAGGGGAGGSGAVGASGIGGGGGPGLFFAISGMELYYAGGGGGGGQDFGSHGLVPGSGGIGGGGKGGLNSIGTAAVNGTGGGGGGGGGGDPSDNFYKGGRGGDGVVIISYETSW